MVVIMIAKTVVDIVTVQNQLLSEQILVEAIIIQIVPLLALRELHQQGEASAAMAGIWIETMTELVVSDTQITDYLCEAAQWKKI